MHNQLKKISLAGILAAMSTILYMFPTFPILPAFPWLEIDFADIPALLASVLINPIIGGIVVLIRNTIHLMVSSTGMVGELSNFIISSMFVVSAGMIATSLGKNKRPSTKRLIVTAIFAIIIQNIVAILCNRFIMIPMYGIQGNPMTYILAGVVPFNAFKTAVSSVMFIILYKAVMPKIKHFL